MCCIAYDITLLTSVAMYLVLHHGDILLRKANKKPADKDQAISESLQPATKDCAIVEPQQPPTNYCAILETLQHATNDCEISEPLQPETIDCEIVDPRSERLDSAIPESPKYDFVTPDLANNSDTDNESDTMTQSGKKSAAVYKEKSESVVESATAKKLTDTRKFSKRTTIQK